MNLDVDLFVKSDKRLEAHSLDEFSTFIFNIEKLGFSAHKVIEQMSQNGTNNFLVLAQFIPQFVYSKFQGIKNSIVIDKFLELENIYLTLKKLIDEGLLLRRFPRFASQINSELRLNREKKILTSKVLNLSQSGALIECEKNQFLKMDSVDIVKINNVKTELQGEIVWVDNHSAKTKLGLSFVNIKAEQLDSLSSLRKGKI